MSQMQIKGSDPDFTLAIREALQWAASRLTSNEGVRPLYLTLSPELDAGLLLAHVLGKPRSYLFGHPNAAMGPGEAEAFAALVERRCGGEPVAYLTGRKGFWSLDLTVTPAVLVPRPETELLVELALAVIPAEADWRVADLGTGSGAVALALAAERPHLAITATDADADALAVATGNAERLFGSTLPVEAQLAGRFAQRSGASTIVFRHGDWFDAFDEGERFDLLLSNPPYVAENDPHLDALAHEPHGALAAGADGLDALRTIIAGACDHLRPGGRLLLEHGADQGPAVRRLLEDAGFDDIETHPDLAGHDRVTTCVGRL